MSDSQVQYDQAIKKLEAAELVVLRADEAVASILHLLESLRSMAPYFCVIEGKLYALLNAESKPIRIDLGTEASLTGIISARDNARRGIAEAKAVIATIENPSGEKRMSNTTTLNYGIRDGKIVPLD